MSNAAMIIGGAGFIGSHLARDLLGAGGPGEIVIYDNFSSGREWHLEDMAGDVRLKIVKADVQDSERLTDAMKGAGIVYHLASNPDIARAVTEPDIDFWQGTYLTNNVVEAARVNGVGRLMYASGSGIYGDTGQLEVQEDHAPLVPISTYGASKLAGEALICSYCHMFDFDASAFRFANVVGPRQTHGVAYDFIRKLSKDPARLEILGDGTQSKSYIYVSDIVRALRLTADVGPVGFTYYNVSTADNITVREIADMVVTAMGLEGVSYEFTGGDRGWKGDVPVVRLDSRKIRALGWSNQYTTEEAIRMSIDSMLADFRAGKIPLEG